MMLSLRRLFWQNTIWFLISLILAFFVWFLTTIQDDPIQQQQFRAVPVQVIAPDGYLITNDPTDSVNITVRGQRSVLATLTKDDIIVTANLQGRSSGTFTLPLETRINRANLLEVDKQPTQITVVLEQAQTVQKPVALEIMQAPPVDYSYDAPVTDMVQAEVRGTASAVARVLQVRGELDLSSQRNPQTLDIPLVAVDTTGAVVPDVVITPATVRVTVNIYARPDVKQVTVRPNIQFETLDAGYVFTSLRTDPQTIFVSGRQSELDALGDTISTQPIDLSGRNTDFIQMLPLVVPDNILILNGSNTVTVEIGISAMMTARQFDSIPVEIIGIPEGAETILTPPTISIVVNGAFNVVQNIHNDDLRAIIDVNGLAVGNYELVPTILIDGEHGEVSAIQTLPTMITVNLAAPTPTPLMTPETTPEN